MKISWLLISYQFYIYIIFDILREKNELQWKCTWLYKIKNNDSRQDILLINLLKKDDLQR